MHVCACITELHAFSRHISEEAPSAAAAHSGCQAAGTCRETSHKAISSDLKISLKKSTGTVGVKELSCGRVSAEEHPCCNTSGIDHHEAAWARMEQSRHLYRAAAAPAVSGQDTRQPHSHLPRSALHSSAGLPAMCTAQLLPAQRGHVLPTAHRAASTPQPPPLLPLLPLLPP
jgi:hypothetical protein